MEKIRYPEPVDLSLYKKDGKDLHAKYGLPKEVAFCKKCVISNQRPNSAVEYQHTKASKKATINFDEHGVCDACNFAEKKNVSIDWLELEAQLKELCDQQEKLFNRLRGAGERTIVYPVHEPWLDVGRPSDLERARYGDDSGERSAASAS
jgi:uncharacterized protein YpuA (DUF1002 family)